MYKDEKLQERQDNYRKSNVNLLKYREKQNLCLRKTKLENYLLEKRLKKNKFNGMNNFGIIPLTLKIEEKYRNIRAYDLDKEEVVNTIFELINSADYSDSPDSSGDNLKYSIYLIREFVSADKHLDCKPLLRRGLLDICEDLILRTNDNNMLYEILWILTNVSCMITEEELRIFLKPSFLDGYIRLLAQQEITEISLQLLWLLRNIVCDVEQYRNIILASDIIDIIFQKINLVLDINSQMQSYNLLRDAFIKSSIELLHNLFNKFEEIPAQLMPQVYKIIPIFTNSYIFRDDQIFSMCIWGLSFISGLSDTEEMKIPQLIMNNNGDIVNIILALDYDTYKELLIPGLHIMGNILSVYNNEFVEFTLNLGVIDFLYTIFQTEKSKKIIKKVLWVISNICGGGFEHIKQIVDHQIFNKVIELCNDYDFSTKKEAIFTVNNICTHKLNFSISTFLVKKGVLEMIIEVLETFKDPVLLQLVLTSLNFILATAIPMSTITGRNSFCSKFEQLGGISALEKMQEHANDNIYRLSLSILENYFKTHIVSYSDMVRDFAERNYCEGNVVDDKINYVSIDQTQSQSQTYNYFDTISTNKNQFSIGVRSNQSSNYSFHESLNLENENYGTTNVYSEEIVNSNKLSNLFHPVTVNPNNPNKRNFYHKNN